MDGHPEFDECAIGSGSDSENESLTQNLRFERKCQKTNLYPSRALKATSLLTLGLKNKIHTAKRQLNDQTSSFHKRSGYQTLKKIDIESSKSKGSSDEPKGALLAETIQNQILTELPDDVQEGISNERSKNSWPASTTPWRKHISDNGRQNERYPEKDALEKKRDDWNRFHVDYNSVCW